MALFARDGSGSFVLEQSISSPAPGITGFEGYGQSVTLLADDELASSQLSDGTTNAFNGSVFLFDIQ